MISLKSFLIEDHHSKIKITGRKRKEKDINFYFLTVNFFEAVNVYALSESADRRFRAVQPGSVEQTVSEAAESQTTTLDQVSFAKDNEFLPRTKS